MNEIEIPEADRQIGTNHPRHTQIIYGCLLYTSDAADE